MARAGSCKVGVYSPGAGEKQVLTWSLFCRYRPNDLPIPEARKAMADKQRESDEERVELYKKIMKHVHPVMRHFFMEKHHLPYWWFQMRLNYSRSAATMSMVGYVMGIGDRHVSNIMIDTARGELVPIDFGIAFEAVGGFLQLTSLRRLTKLLLTGKATPYTGIRTFPSYARYC